MIDTNRQRKNQKKLKKRFWIELIDVGDVMKNKNLKNHEKWKHRPPSSTLQ